MPPLLLIAATELEAELVRKALYQLKAVDTPLGKLFRGSLRADASATTPDTFLAVLGIAKVNTAAGLALLLDRLRPAAVLQFGIGGAYVGAFLQVGSVAVAKEDIHIDTGVRTTGGWQDMENLGFPLTHTPLRYNRFPTSSTLSAYLAALCHVEIVTFATSEAISGDFSEAARLQQVFDLSVESMEGAAAAQVCSQFNTPFAEIRGISNIVGERDKKAWDIASAVRNVSDIVLQFLEQLANHDLDLSSL